MSVGRIIETAADVAEGAVWLAAVEPRFAAVWRSSGPWPLRRRDGGFAAVLFAIVGQQVSVASAAACWSRIEAAGFTDPGRVARASDEALRACGLSRPKLRYARALAESGFDYAALAGMADDAVVDRLVALPGVGRWTAEIYASCALGRADVIAAGDLAMQEAARVLFDLPARPVEAELRAMAAPWSPWRGVAARGLWAYYQHVKARGGIA